MPRDKRPVPGGFIRAAKSVAYDTTLTFAARCIYNVLADRVGVGSTTAIGIRKIARTIGAHKETVGECLRELSKRGHIKITGTRKSRRIYALLSPVYGGRQGKEDIILAGPSGVPRFASIDHAKHGIKEKCG